VRREADDLEVQMDAAAAKLVAETLAARETNDATAADLAKQQQVG
jgi:hypothetical protein